MITSTANDSVKYVRALQRRRFRYQERAFLVEGLRTVEEAIQAGLRPAFLCHTPALAELPRAQLLLSRAEEAGIPIRAVSEPVMAAMSDTVTPAGLLAVLPMSESALPRPLTWALVLDRIRDPGNLGTILRSALAAGVELVIASRGTVDAYSPKVVRAAMGAHFRLKLRLDQSWGSIQDLLHGLRVLGARPRDASPYWQMDWQRPTALWIGGEAEGASPEAERLITEYVTIPMRENVESLNTAVAAGILLFEASRQRFTAGDVRTNRDQG